MGQLMHFYRFAAILFWFLGSLLSVEALGATTYSLEAHPLASNLEMAIYLGNPADNPGTPPLGTIGPGALTGTVEIDLDLDASGNGTIQFLGSQLLFEDLSGTFDLGPLGTLDYAAENIAMTWESMPIEVVAGEYSAPFVDNVVLTFFAGSVVLGNATGALADLVGTGDLFYQDYSVDPHTAFWGDTEQEFFGTADSGPGGLTNASEVSLLISDTTFFFRRFADIGEFYVGFDAKVYVATPEPSSLVLASVGFMGLFVVVLRNQRKKTGSFPDAGT